MDFEFIQEAFESPAFWILGGGGTIAALFGWIISKKIGVSLPFWQLLAIIVAILGASAYFATRE